MRNRFTQIPCSYEILMHREKKCVDNYFYNEQDTLIGLRHQLDEVKAINVEMYQKMQVMA